MLGIILVIILVICIVTLIWFAYVEGYKAAMVKRDLEDIKRLIEILKDMED